MGLEAAQYLNELNLANPTFQDFISEGDDHLRGVKRAAMQTFPGMAGRAWRKRSVAASGPLNLTDNMTLILASGVLTLTPADAAVLGNGWMVMVRATAGNVTINPAQNINGTGSIVVPTGYTSILLCDGSEFFSMLVYQDVPVAVQAFVTGTKIVFQQTAAPVGWTKVTSATHNDAALRFTTGTVGTGGADVFTTVFGTGKTTAGHALTISQMPSHTHTASNIGPSSGSYSGGGSFGASGTTDATGGGASHSHPLSNMNLKFVDAIVASKD